MKLSRIKAVEINKLLKRLLFTLVKRAFLFFLGLLVVALIFGAIIYYQYNILAQKEEPQTIKKSLQFQEKTYRNVSRAWQEREKNFREADSKEYVNPFRADQIREVTPEEQPEPAEINEPEESTPEEPSGSSEVEQEGTDLEGPHTPTDIDQE
jgi:hypothetical protein